MRARLDPLLYRVRATIKDRPGVLASLARSCGEAGINILSLQVFPSHDGVTDELVVSVGQGWTEVRVHELVVAVGGEQVSVTRCTARSLHDAPTSYLQAAARVADGRARLSEELARLLETDPPDVADYAGHDTITFGEESVARAVPFSPAERARARALIDLVDTLATRPATVTARVGASRRDAPATSVPRPPRDVRAGRPAEGPHVRPATPEDVPLLVDLHGRCSEDTLYHRYHAPMSGVIHRRMARRLAAPVGGTAVVAEAGRVVVGHAMAVPLDDESPGTWELGVVVEDAWQRRGVGTSLVRHAARLARAGGADEVVLVTQPGNDAVLRTIGRAGFLARIARADNTVRITVDVGLC
ncbi:GNAT family N-acetyltransferase [Mumia sp. DW29H23]|uniref:GNAT family N-acetyltransferase n=1 Tax=Mumia sp. DW29H23 TaxID=3421241 RepID=UPI003D68AD63